MRGDAHSALGAWDWLRVTSAQVRAEASPPSRRGRWFWPLAGKSCPITSQERGLRERLSWGGFCKASPRPPVPILFPPPSQRVCRCSPSVTPPPDKSPRHSCHLDSPGGASPPRHTLVSLTGVPKTGLNSRPTNLCAKTHGGRCVLEFGIFSFQNNTSVYYLHICIYAPIYSTMGFPGGSDDKESACNVGDPGSILGWGRSPGERNGYPHQYSYVEKPTDKEALQAVVHRVAKSRTQLSD